MSTCRPEDHSIQLNEHYRIQVIHEDEGTRYIPQYKGQSLLPEGQSRQVLRDARNDCARHAGLEVIG